MVNLFKKFKSKKETNIPGKIIYFSGNDYNKFHCWCNYHSLFYLYRIHCVLILIFGLLLLEFYFLPFVLIDFFFGVFLEVLTIMVFLGILSFYIVKWNRRLRFQTKHIFGVENIDELIEKFGIDKQ